MRCCSIVLLFALIGVSAVQAQPDSTSRRSRTAGETIALDAAYIVPAGVIFLLNHEFGHYTFAAIGGGHNIRFGIYRPKPEGGAQLGWTDWEGEMSPLAHEGAMLGGVVFSRGLAEGTDLLVRSSNLPSWSQPFFAATFLLGRFDFARYVLFDALHELGNRPGSDIHHFVTDIAGNEGGGKLALYALLFGLATVDLIFDWDRVSRYAAVIAGREYPYDRPPSDVSLSLSPCLVNATPGIHVELRF